MSIDDASDLKVSLTSQKLRNLTLQPIPHPSTAEAIFAQIQALKEDNEKLKSNLSDTAFEALREAQEARERELNPPPEESPQKDMSYLGGAS